MAIMTGTLIKDVLSVTTLTTLVKKNRAIKAENLAPAARESAAKTPAKSASDVAAKPRLFGHHAHQNRRLPVIGGW
jgi:hypothetical protein